MLMPDTACWPMMKHFGPTDLNLSPAKLPSFVAAHSATIRSLEIYSSITGRHLIALSGIHGLQLESIYVS